MTFLLGWLLIAVLIALVGATAGALLAALATPLLSRLARVVAPGRRLWILRFLIGAPLIGAAIALGLAFYPSLFHLAGLLADHCAQHAGQGLHLCFLHFSPPPLEPTITTATLAIAAFLSWRWTTKLSAAWRTRRWANRLLQLARYDADLGAHIVDSDRFLALTAGFFRPQILVSRGLVEALSAPQLQAVLAHEQSHRHRGDARHQLLVTLAASLHLPGIGGRLVDAITLAAEQRCDRAAAASIGDRFTVAEAILAVARGPAPMQAPAALPAFCSAPVEPRIKALLQGDWPTTPWIWALPTGAMTVVAATTNFHFLHHLMEHSLIWLT